MIFISLILPAPFSPMSACTEPGRSLSVTPSNALTPGNSFEIPLTSKGIAGILAGLVEHGNPPTALAGSAHTASVYPPSVPASPSRIARMLSRRAAPTSVMPWTLDANGSNENGPA